MIENTTVTNRDMPPGPYGPGMAPLIEQMEAEGQRQLVASSLLPADLSPTDEQAWTDLGFTLGEPADGDPLFRHATLPTGWKREGSDHAMHSYLVDERGIRRVNIFYKAAFYDRRASMTLVNVGRSLATQGIYGDDEPNIPWGQLTESERGDLLADLRAYLVDADRHPDIYNGQLPRVRAILAAAPDTAAHPCPDDPGR